MPPEYIEPQPIERRPSRATPVFIILAIIVVSAVGFMYRDSIAALLSKEENTEMSVTTTNSGPVNEISPLLFALKADDHILGSPSATIRIVEYADFECAFCKRFHNTMLQVIEDYGKKGEVAWVYRHFPLDSIHPKARKEAEATECAAEIGGRDAFWKYMNRLLEITPINKSLDLKELPEIAAFIGIDKQQFQSCLDSGRYASRIERDFVEGVDAGIGGTPFSFAVHKDGRIEKIAGAHTYKNVSILLDNMLHAKPGEANTPK